MAAAELAESIAQTVYYKGTRKGGVSYHDKSFVYHMGLNVHPRPDKTNTLCSDGIHLAKHKSDLTLFCGTTPEEVYECRAGVIYAEDNDKVRVGYCFVDRLIQPEFLAIVPENTLCGAAWLKEHWGDHTQAEIDSLGMEVITPRSTVTVKAKMTAKNVRTAVQAVVR